MTDREHQDCGCAEYNTLSRRDFIVSSAGISLSALFPAWLPRVTLAGAYASNRDVIVSIFLRGGADGLTLCAPFGDPNYYKVRNYIAVPQPDSSSTFRGVNLDGFFMFPHAMTELVPAFTAGDLLVVHATGQLQVSRSHFDAQRFMEVGQPNSTTVASSGWLGRHLASTPPAKADAKLRGLGVASGLQKTLVSPRGDTRTLPIADPTNFVVAGPPASAAQRLEFLAEDYEHADEPVRSSALDALNTFELLKSVNFAGYRPANGATYDGDFAFSRALKAVATLIKADIGIEAAQVDLGGWDTHVSQGPDGGAMWQSMNTLARALAAFHADVVATGHKVTVIVMSEFGRTVRENGSGGTDHGCASAMLLLGNAIKGGRVLTKQWPGLAIENLQDRQDLKVTVDYRDVLSEIVERRLGNSNLRYIFPGWQPSFLGVTR